jgi:hypothetical protein
MRASVRTLAVLVLLGGAAAALLSGCAVFLGEQGRYLVEQKNRVEVPTRYESMTFKEFLALPSLSTSYTDGQWQQVRAQSARAVSIEGYIAEVRQVFDGPMYGKGPWAGDLHVHLREQPQSQCFPPGPRGEQIVTEVTPHFQPPKTAWSEKNLRDLCDRQVRVRLSGLLMHDYPHLDGVGRWRNSAWEIHPVTKIEVWDASRQAWQLSP